MLNFLHSQILTTVLIIPSTTPNAMQCLGSKIMLCGYIEEVSNVVEVRV